MKRSSKIIGEHWRAFERNTEIGRYAGLAFGVATASFVGFQALNYAKETFMPDAASGCFHDNGSLYLTYEEEGKAPKKAGDSWAMAADGKRCETAYPFAPNKSVPVVRAP